MLSTETEIEQNLTFKKMIAVYVYQYPTTMNSRI